MENFGGGVFFAFSPILPNNGNVGIKKTFPPVGARQDNAYPTDLIAKNSLVLRLRYLPECYRLIQKCTTTQTNI